MFEEHAKAFAKITEEDDFVEKDEEENSNEEENELGMSNDPINGIY